MSQLVGQKVEQIAGVERLPKPLQLAQADPRLANVKPATIGRENGNVAQTIPAKRTCGRVVENFYQSFYNRILVIPNEIALGNMATEQSLTVSLWNAKRHAINITALRSQNAEGITLIGDNAPFTLNAMNLKRWTLNVSMQGAANIQAGIFWEILNAGKVSLRITGRRTVLWHFPPDWTDSVVENLQFLTRVHQSITGAEQRIARRLSPRRSFEFSVTLDNRTRQRFENNLYAFGSRVWDLPIFIDRQLLGNDVEMGTTTLQITTTGYDFTENGRLLLEENGEQHTAEIIKLTADSVTLKRPLPRAFSSQAWVYPLRSAVLTEPPALTRLSDNATQAQVRLQLHEHNANSANIGERPTYRHHVVLEPASDWNEDITASFIRLVKTLDNQTGLPVLTDTAGKTFQITTHHFLLENRQQQQALRALFYYLRGRQRAIWVSSNATDIHPVSDIHGNTFDIEYQQFAQTAFGQNGRRDIRLELNDGRVLYRRIVAATVLNAQRERLSLDGDELNVSLSNLRKLSFLTLSRLESDTIRWQHHTDSDGVATVSVNFRAVRDDLEAV